jgi:hypothetical protein
MIFGVERSCTDNIFSGHTGLMTVCALTWWYYSRHIWLVVLVWLWVMVGVLWILITRMHYTIDVVLGGFIAYALYRLYLAGVEHALDSQFQQSVSPEHATNTQSNTSPSLQSASGFMAMKRNLCVVPRRLKRRNFVAVFTWMDGLDLRLQRWREQNTIELGRTCGSVGIDVV